MFCNKCGSQVPDGASFCSVCGTRVFGESSNFGTAMPFFEKKEYFQTACTQKAKNIIKAGKIVLIVCAILIFASLATSLIETNAFFEEAYKEKDIKAVFERLEELSGKSFGYTEEQYADLRKVEADFEKEFGMTLVEFIEIIVYAVFAFMGIAAVVVIILSFFTIRNINLTTAIIALIISLLFVGVLASIGMTITLLVFVCKLRKEYNAYCANPYAFANPSNEPDFSN